MRKSRRRVLSVEVLEDRVVPDGPHGLDVPTGHPRLWFTPERLAQARTWYAANPFSPRADSPLDNALSYQLSGNLTHAQRAVDALMAFRVPDAELTAVASNEYRWSDWVPVVYDWCYDRLTPAQRSEFTARYNLYADTFMVKPWGGPGMTANNYYWGYWRNEMNWGVTSYRENARADAYLTDALVTRWQNDFLPYAAGPAAGGVPAEGTEYGRHMLEYSVVPLATAGLLGRDLFTETNFYTEAAYYSIYATSPGPVADGSGGLYHQVFPFNDDEAGGFTAAATTDIADYMTAVAGRFGSDPLGGYARQWLTAVGAQPHLFAAAVDAGGPTRPLSELPTDYYAPGVGYLYARSGWSAGATALNFQLGAPDGGTLGHQHMDAGSFQLLRGGQWLTKETTGYARDIVGLGGQGTVGVDSPPAHNTLLVGGLGQIFGWATGTPRVTRLESRPGYVFASVDLTPAYRATRPQNDNPAVRSVVRDFVYVRDLDALVVLDRLESAAAADPKTFLLHFPTAPTVSGNTAVGVSGGQALRLTMLTPAGQSAPAVRVVDERPATTAWNVDYHYRLEATTSGGSARTHLVSVLQARDAGAADLQVGMTEDATSFTITLRDAATGKTAVVKLAKGMTSAGGSFGFSTSGSPALAPLAAGVQEVRATPDGVTWGQPALQVTSAASATAGSALAVTVRATDGFGGVNAGYTGTVHFTSTDPRAGLPANYTFTTADAGAHTFTVTLRTAAAQTVTAADVANGSWFAGAVVEVNPAAAATFVVGGYPSPTTAGVAHTFIVTARDAFGNTATGYAGTVHFTSGDPQAGLPADGTLSNGTTTFTATFRTEGSASLTATDTTTASITGTQSGITVILPPAPPPPPGPPPPQPPTPPPPPPGPPPVPLPAGPLPPPGQPANPGPLPALAGGRPDGTALILDPSGGRYVPGLTLTFFPGLGVNARTATADVTGDGVPDFVGGTGPGVPTGVAVIDGATLHRLVAFSPFESTFTGGVFVAAADLDGDGKAEVLVTPDLGGGPVVVVYGGARLAAGAAGAAAQLTRFFGIQGDPNFRGGARPALGDVNGDRTPDLVVSAGYQGGPRIALFDGRALAAGAADPRKLTGDFFAFESTLRNGAFVAAGDLGGDGFADVAFGGGPNGAPRVRLFDGKTLLVAGPFAALDDVASAQLANFFAGDPTSRGGVRLALRDADGDGRADLITGSGEGDASRVRVYKAAGLLTGPPPSDQELDPFGSVLAGGVFVG